MRTYISILTFAAIATLGCNSYDQSSTPVPAETTQASFNTAGNPTVEIDAPGLHCEHCSASACKILADVPGVVDVQANSETKKITIAIDQSEFDSDAAISALHENSQFEDSEVAGTDAASNETEADGEKS